VYIKYKVNPKKIKITICGFVLLIGVDFLKLVNVGAWWALKSREIVFQVLRAISLLYGYFRMSMCIYVHSLKLMVSRFRCSHYFIAVS